MWKAAHVTERPVKFGAVSAEIISFAVQDRHYKSVPDRMFAIAEALNENTTNWPTPLPRDPDEGADSPDRGAQHQDAVINPKLMVGVFNRTVKGSVPRPRSGRIRAGAIRRRSACFASVTYKPALGPTTPSMPT
jgi:hypothetical protein